MDPMILALSGSKPPTHNHYHHDWFGYDSSGTRSKRLSVNHQSLQKPRKERLNDLKNEKKYAINTSLSLEKPPLEVICQVRTRIPTPHGEIFCHLYTNNHDKKEHLAFVVDPEQLQREFVSSNDLRSKSLDAIRSGESELDRLTRGAYVGKIKRNSAEINIASTNSLNASPYTLRQEHKDPLAPLVRIHSECYTGETIGSQRCDCGEQLDEALRQMFVGTSKDQHTKPRGVIVYMRQEGRGIGLAAKLRAYNLQDLGHDTVTANELLGFGADERTYEISASILRDLGLGIGSSGIRLMTNNPDKVNALEFEGIPVSDRVEMIPRAWKCNHLEELKIKGLKQKHLFANPRRFSTGGEQTPTCVNEKGEEEDKDVFAKTLSTAENDSGDEYLQHVLRRSGAGLIGAGATQGEDLERYLRTKIERMGHLITIPKDKKQIEEKK
ncbi:hypothetical protein E3Q22_01448 [Wallemia mellicola]|uniref:GTP cyclohydrolase II n=1 Tax=Wallemia mellicola TaxID=1708541 RepID=A0A4T0MD15_9BASI|nr:hypothetical protein E3Q22_01448 [Wallemia mellicola]TIC02864.1 hypothetical protein E3Q17_01119 [Wallemia mellicola]